MEEIVPVVVDTVLRTNTFTTVALARPKTFRAATQDFPIKYKTGTTTQSFIGLQQLPTAFTDTRVSLKYNPAFYEANVTIVGTDALANNTARKVIDLVEVEMASREAQTTGAPFRQSSRVTAAPIAGLVLNPPESDS